MTTREDYAQKTAKWIKHWRQRLGLSQAQIAEAIDVSSCAVSQWERGVGVLSAYSREKLELLFRTKRAERSQAAKRHAAMQVEASAEAEA